MSAPAPRQALVLAATAELGFAAGTCLTGFLAHNPDFPGDVLLLHDGLTDGDLRAFARLCPRLHPVALSTATIAARLAASEAVPPALLAAALARCHPYVLAKFEIFDWLAQYDHLVWFDLDLLVRAPLAHLWRIEAPLGWRPLPEGGRARRAAQLGALEALEAPQGGPKPPLPNAGVLTLAAAPLRAAGVDAATLYALAAQAIAAGGGRTPDELALYLLAARHQLEIAALPLADNHPVAQDGSEAARILHAIGPDKFWTATPLAHACPDWAGHHRHWRALGGSAAPEPTLHAKVHPLSAAGALTFARNRGFWQGFWPLVAPSLPPGLWPELRSERGFLRLHLSGTPEALHLDIARGARDQRFRLSLGIETALLEDPALPERLDRHAASLGLTRHDGRRILAFSTDCRLEDLSAEIHRLTPALEAERP